MRLKQYQKVVQIGSVQKLLLIWVQIRLLKEKHNKIMFLILPIFQTNFFTAFSIYYLRFLKVSSLLIIIPSATVFDHRKLFAVRQSGDTRLNRNIRAVKHATANSQIAKFGEFSLVLWSYFFSFKFGIRLSLWTVIDIA